MKPSGRIKIFCVLAGLAFAASASAENYLVYFGTYTNALSRGIYVSRLDAASGNLSAPELAAASPSPCFLAVSPDGKFLYAANSVKDFGADGATNGGAVSAFAIERGSGRLTLLNQKWSGGAGPCQVSVDATGKILFVANYGSGSVKAFLLATNGALGAGGSCVQLTGHGINPGRQAGPHPHCIGADPSNRFALVCDLGTDTVTVYPFTTNDATLDVTKVKSFRVPPGAGPRHLAFSRNGKFAYVINELAGTVTGFAWDAANGSLVLGETLELLPEEVAMQPSYTAAEMLAHPSGHFVYATVRGHDSVSVFAADPKTGRLTLVQNVSAGGKVPRGMGIDPTGRWLIVANQMSDKVVEFAIDAATGRLSPAGPELTIGSPADVKFVK